MFDEVDKGLLIILLNIKNKIQKDVLKITNSIVNQQQNLGVRLFKRLNHKDRAQNIGVEVDRILSYQLEKKDANYKKAKPNESWDLEYNHFDTRILINFKTVSYKELKKSKRREGDGYICNAVKIYNQLDPFTYYMVIKLARSIDKNNLFLSLHSINYVNQALNDDLVLKIEKDGSKRLRIKGYTNYIVSTNTEVKQHIKNLLVSAS